VKLLPLLTSITLITYQQTKQFITTITEHYPELLNKSFIVNPTWYIHVVLKVITPFMDPVTRAKIHLVNAKALVGKRQAPADNAAAEEDASPRDHGHDKELAGGLTNPLFFIEEDQLLRTFGGDCPLEWDFDRYWDSLCQRLQELEAV
jgi:hypothetical protein